MNTPDDVITLDSEQMRALASDMRAAIGPEGYNPDYLRSALINAADLLDDVAQDKRDPALVQAAIDAVQQALDRQEDDFLDHVCLRFLQAVDGDDPTIRREATLQLIQVLPEELLFGVTQAIFACIQQFSIDAGYCDLATMQPVGLPC